MAPRRDPRAQAPRSSRLASLFFAVGCLAVLSTTFALGVAAGRRWPGGLPLPGLGGSPAATVATPAVTAGSRGERDTVRRAEARSLDKGKATTEGAPTLTFYHELTAPLASTPPPPRAAAKRETKPVEVTKPAPRPAETLKPVTSDAALVEAPPREPATSASPTSISRPRFTVQVGSFKARAQAEALRARLAESGQEVDVTEGAAGGVTQYRVRVGTFATRAAARETAARIEADRRLATYVTTR